MQTSRMKLPFPDRKTEPYYDGLLAFANAVDVATYANKEDRNLVFLGGGTLAFNISGDDGVLSWDSPIHILSADTGFFCIISASSITLQDGEIFYATLTRGPRSNVIISTSKSFALESNNTPNNAFLVGYRSDTKIYFHNGKIIGDGESGALFEITTLAASSASLQSAYEFGNEIVTDSSFGDFSVAGTENIVLSGPDIQVSGNVLVNSGTFGVRDNYIKVSASYLLDSAQTGGLVVNYDPSETSTTVNGVYVAGANAESNPSVITSGSATFLASDIIQISSSDHNNGVFEVLSHVGTTLVIRGVGVTPTVEDFTRNQFVDGSSDSAVITKIAVAVIRAGVSGLWEVGSGSVTPISFLTINSGTYVSAISGEALLAGNLVSYANSGGLPRVFKSDANGAGTLINAVGFNLSAVGSSGSVINIIDCGELSIADAIWDSVPADTDVGKRVFMSETAGKLTLTAPTTIGSCVLRVAIVTQGGTGSVKVKIQIGESIILGS